MRELLFILKYRKLIIYHLKYSFAEVNDYKYLTQTEKILISNKEFNKLKQFLCK